jgi:PcfJ-like protein
MEEVQITTEQVPGDQLVPVQGIPLQQSIHPLAEYLSDEKGLYGIRINHPSMPMEICVRPDKLKIRSYTQLWMHCIPRKTKEGSLEQLMVDRLVSAIKITKHPEFVGILHPKYLGKEDCRKFFAIPWYSRRIINGMWKKILAEAADQDALKLCKRFHISRRRDIYVAACTSLRARQLIEAFPFLGAQLYHNATTNTMVEDGEKLKTIAAAVRVPWAMRKIKPGAVHALPAMGDNWRFFKDHPDIIHAYFPQQTMRQYRWLMLLSMTVGNQYRCWLMKNLPTDQKLQVLIEDAQLLRDWYNDGQFLIGDPARVHELPRCTWETAKERSVEWHRTVAERFARNNALLNEEARLEALKPFPEPWLPGQVENTLGEPLTDIIGFRIHEYSIVPLTTGAMLEEEGLRMHHCVAGYASYVKSGSCYIYSVRKGDKSIATIELCRGNAKKRYDWQPDWLYPPGPADPISPNIKTSTVYEYGVRQMRGPCNAEVHHSIKGMVNRWLESENRRCLESGKSLSMLQQDSEEASYLAAQQVQLYQAGLLEPWRRLG